MTDRLTVADLLVLTTIEKLRERAADALLGESAEARLCGKLADDIERQYRAALDEEVTVEEAARLSGYDESSIRRMIQEKKITLRRGDIPRKPGFGASITQRPRNVPAGGSLAERIQQGRAGNRRRAAR